ncbi:MAG: hypothetical protein ACRDRS_04605 [Pseudonocardiaceae bacterium]
MAGVVALVKIALGVGVLLLLAITADTVPAAPWVWVLCCLLGMLVGYTVAAAGTPPPARHPVVRSWYIGGTAVGQGFICWTASAYLGGALNLGRTTVLLMACGLLVACTFMAYRGWGSSAIFRQARLGATLAVALGWLCWPTALHASAAVLGPGPGTVGAVFLVLISAVGWESTREALSAAGSGGPGWRTAGQLVTAGVVVLVSTAGFTALRLTRTEPIGGGSPPLRVGLSVLLFVLAGCYCMTNVRFAGRLLDQSRADPERSSERMRSGTCWVAGVAVLVMVLALLTGSGTWQLLLGPGSMTWAIFLLYSTRVLLQPKSPLSARCTGAAALVLLACVAAPVWPALLFPVLTGGLAIVLPRRKWSVADRAI